MTVAALLVEEAADKQFRQELPKAVNCRGNRCFFWECRIEAVRPVLVVVVGRVRGFGRVIKARHVKFLVNSTKKAGGMPAGRGGPLSACRRREEEAGGDAARLVGIRRSATEQPHVFHQRCHHV